MSRVETSLKDSAVVKISSISSLVKYSKPNKSFFVQIIFQQSLLRLRHQLLLSAPQRSHSWPWEYFFRHSQRVPVIPGGRGPLKLPVGWILACPNHSVHPRLPAQSFLYIIHRPLIPNSYR